ncbi:hypothetical protein BBJ28_00000664 [Nothophytophthora sp. Chile5]|nr:hypothetical protein BBJ28_00000664 [Nothophytophthora sp. Chile5]
MQMYTYSRSTGFWRVLLVLLTTPIPSLVLVALLDALSLKSTELGLAHSGTTWVRGVFMTIIESYAVISLLQHDVVNLELSSCWTLTIFTATALVNNALALGITTLLWYPLPFILFWMAWPWIALLVLFVWLVKGAFIRANPGVLTKLRHFSSVATSQLATIMAYSIFKAVFLIVPTAWRPAFAMILPVFKLAQKNLLARMLKDRDDLKPQVIVFNVEISNALFITNSVQTGVSIDTSILLIATDFLQLLVSIYDLSLMLSDVRDFTNKLEVDSRQAVATAFTIMETHPGLAEKKVLDRVFQSKADLFRNRTRRSAVVTIECISPQFQ